MSDSRQPHPFVEHANLLDSLATILAQYERDAGIGEHLVYLTAYAFITRELLSIGMPKSMLYDLVEQFMKEVDEFRAAHGVSPAAPDEPRGLQ